MNGVKKLKRKAKRIGYITIGSVLKQISDGATLSLGIGVGLIQGLKYNGSLKRGIKAGLVTVGVVASVNVVRNIADNWEAINQD
jgi:exosortase/archaeosortase